MKIHIETDEKQKELEVHIRCRTFTPELEQLIAMMRMMDMQITGKKDAETFLIDITQILYIEAVQRKTFLYTEKEMYESNLHLYELEERLCSLHFFRASKSMIINLRHIHSLKADIGRRILITLSNGEKQIVSRKYADTLKNILEGK